MYELDLVVFDMVGDRKEIIQDAYQDTAQHIDRRRPAEESFRLVEEPNARCILHGIHSAVAPQQPQGSRYEEQSSKSVLPVQAGLRADCSGANRFFVLLCTSLFCNGSVRNGPVWNRQVWNGTI